MAFGLLVLAHVFADFMAQGKSMVQNKEEGKLRGYLSHGVIVLLALLVVFSPMLHGRLVVALVALALLHLIIDFFKGLLSRWVSLVGEVGLFLADQALHFIVLLGFWLYWVPICGEEPLIRWSIETMLPLSGKVWFQQIVLDWFNIDFLSTMIIYITVIYGGAIFVRKVLNISPIAPPQTGEKSYGEMLDIGRYIGMAERMILLTLTVMNATSAVAFVLTAKSIARYQELNQKDFAEYYLTGTLLSTGIALLGGVLLQRLWIAL